MVLTVVILIRNSYLAIWHNVYINPYKVDQLANLSQTLMYKYVMNLYEMKVIY